MYQVCILITLARFCAIVAQQKTTCAPTSACGNTQSLQCEPRTSLSSLTSSSVRGRIHEEAFHVVICLVWLVCSWLSDCKKYSQLSDGLNSFALSKVDLFLGLWAALIEKGVGWYSVGGQVSGTSSVQWTCSEWFLKQQKTPPCFGQSSVLCLVFVVDFGSRWEYERVSWIKLNVLDTKLQVLSWCWTGVWHYRCTVVFFSLSLFLAQVTQHLCFEYVVHGLQTREVFFLSCYLPSLQCFRLESLMGWDKCR